MIAIRAILALAFALGGEIALGTWLPGAQRYVDLMMLPVIGYALARSQRSALLIGCVGGLLEDAWFQAGLFGSSGFSKTLLGWALGGIASRFEMNVAWGRAAAGAALPVLDRLVELGLRRLFDLPSAPYGAAELALRALAGALLAVGVFAILDRGRPRGPRGVRGARRAA